ncbi:CDP-glycerol glycerophosphotransferase family protein [Alteribacter populi]|uniref:CDP-glycerol glycerophosphotransferase family protein n=1 Tax=Alteribacter populi TaxID=2011011 RepID=UPI000BBAFB28|nr:CDP-glycerol glycerophosphotransferase family protein [Alteribacter populi]
MYGEEKLNPHHTLRYSLTKEFFETFSSLKYRDIELPLVLTRVFHVYIKRHVDSNLKNTHYVSMMQKKHSLFNIRDAQRTLARNPRLKKDLSAVANRKMILMPARMAPFAIDQLSQYNVMFTISNKEDKRTLKSVTIPKHMQVFDFHKRLRYEKTPEKSFANIIRKAKTILKSKQLSPIFKSNQFKKWLFKNLKTAIKTIKMLGSLVRKTPIKVIIDHVEIVNPGTTLSLLAKKYNLPFIHIPQVLISDRSLIPTRASHYCSWGKHYKNWLTKRGVPTSRIYETGNLNFEYKKRANYLFETPLRQKYNIPSHHKIITFTTQPFTASVNETIVNWIQRAVDHSDPITLLIRPHPFDKVNYHALFKHHNVIVTSTDLNLYNLLLNTDVVMTISSNTSIEAAMLGKGVFVLQPPIPYHYEHNNNNFNSHLARAKAGPSIASQSQLSKQMKEIVNDPKYLSLLSKQSQKFLQSTIHSKGRPSVLIRRTIVNALQEEKKVSDI